MANKNLNINALISGKFTHSEKCKKLELYTYGNLKIITHVIFMRVQYHSLAVGESSRFGQQMCLGCRPPGTAPSTNKLFAVVSDNHSHIHTT